MGKSKETVNDRVKLIRKTLDMTQEEFAKKIFVSHGQVSAMELSRSIVNDQNISLMCTPNRFKENCAVNEKWLRDGQGDMFVPQTAADGRPKLFENEKELPADEKELIGVYRELIPENKKYISDTAKNVMAAQENMKEYLNPGKEEKGDMRKLG